MMRDALTENDVEVSRVYPPAKKLAQALDMMETGIRLKRAALAHTLKQATEQQLDEALSRWLWSNG